MRRLVRDLSSVLIITGVLLLLDVAVTIAWQEPVTAVIALVQRSELNTRFLSFRAVPLSPSERTALTSLSNLPARIAFLARREARRVPTGAAIGVIEIPRIGVRDDIVEGTDAASLERGPGHYPSTAFPGLGETVAIAGHRTTYLEPFRNINELERGDRIAIDMPYADFTYAVQFQRVVSPDAWWITRNVGYERLVLSACTPLYSAAQRLVVFARLVRVRPTAVALSTPALAKR